MDHPRPHSAPPPSADAPQLLPVRDDRRQDLPPSLAPEEAPDSLIPSFTYHIYADVVHGCAQDNARAPTGQAPRLLETNDLVPSEIVTAVWSASHIGAESFLDRQGRYMARGRCACCGRAVEQYVTVSVYEALR